MCVFLKGVAMEIVNTGRIDPNGLDRLVDLDNEVERAGQVSFARLDLLMTKLGEDYPSYVDRYAEKLLAMYRSLSIKEIISEDELDTLLETRKSLRKYRDLAKELADYHLGELRTNTPAESGTVTMRGFLRSALAPACRHLHVLIDLLGREEAFAFYKRFITARGLQRQENQKDKVADIDELFRDVTKEEHKDSNWRITHARLDDGKYAYKNHNCEWIEALYDFPDSEVKYHVCCYGDYQGTKGWNRHFVFTMDHTIAQGDEYCARVVHDTRISWILDHPDREFWNGL